MTLVENIHQILISHQCQRRLKIPRANRTELKRRLRFCRTDGTRPPANIHRAAGTARRAAPPGRRRCHQCAGRLESDDCRSRSRRDGTWLPLGSHTPPNDIELSTLYLEQKRLTHRHPLRHWPSLLMRYAWLPSQCRLYDRQWSLRSSDNCPDGYSDGLTRSPNKRSRNDRGCAMRQRVSATATPFHPLGKTLDAV